MKYISQKESDGENGQAKFEEKIPDAKTQLRQYADDPRIQEVTTQVSPKKIALVYKRWQLAHAEEV